jgi:hypothetical protein
MMMITTLFGQFGLRASSSGAEPCSHQSLMFSRTPVIEESALPILIEGRHMPSTNEVSNRLLEVNMHHGSIQEMQRKVATQ